MVARTSTGASIAPRVDGTTGNDIIVGRDGVGNVIYGGAGDDLITGGNDDDVIVGDAGRDTLRGGDGNDSMWGGGGDDVLEGGAGIDKLFGDGGNDLIDGGAGDDQMSGGTGNDTYIVDSAGDTIVEKAGEGIDTVQASVSYTLSANVENLVLTGSGNIDGTGNDGDNVITGNGGNNVLRGGGGNDTLLGGAGSDTLYGDAGNDTLDGGTGADTMAGGSGDDLYYVDSLSDVVVEQAGEGVDTMVASVNVTLAANVENLILTGSGNTNGTGNALDNLMSGTSGTNVLRGGAGGDTISGGAGNDQLYGEDGNDRIDGGDGADLLNGGAGTDTIVGGTGNDGVYGGGGNDTILGQDGNDRIYGDGGNDVIWGGGGSDVMTGGQQNGLGDKGANTYGWTRSDVVDAGGAPTGLDHITDFGARDRLDFSGLFANTPPADLASMLRITDTAAGTVVAADVGGGQFVDIVVLDNVHDLSLDDLVQAQAIVI